MLKLANNATRAHTPPSNVVERRWELASRKVYMIKKTLKKLGLPMLALAGVLMFVGTPKADAAVRFGVGIGVGGYYPGYAYPYAYPGYAYPYAYPYGYGYPYYGGVGVYGGYG